MRRSSLCWSITMEVSIEVWDLRWELGRWKGVSTCAGHFQLRRAWERR